MTFVAQDMINMAKETAEQKLLRLIEQGGDSSSSGAAQAASSSAQEVLSAVQSVGGSASLPPAVLNILNLFKSFFAGFSAGHESFGIRQLNKILMVAVIGLTVFFLTSVTAGLKKADEVVSFDQPKTIPFSATKLLPMIPDLKQYVSAVSLRNIFHPYEKKEVVTTDESAPQIPQVLAEKTKSLKLVGISWFDTPESASAMVENTESGVTYFLRSGEKVNGLTVQTIYADSIVLEMNGERMELKL